MLRAGVGGDGGAPRSCDGGQGGVLSAGVGAVLPEAEHRTRKLVQQGIERDHGHVKSRIRSRCWCKTDRTAGLFCRAHGFIRNCRTASLHGVMYWAIRASRRPPAVSWPGRNSPRSCQRRSGPCTTAGEHALRPYTYPSDQHDPTVPLWPGARPGNHRPGQDSSGAPACRGDS